MATFTGFEAHDYVSLTTYKKSGETASTPVWIVPKDGKLYVWTNSASWKVKRLRRDPRCSVAPCNASGKKILGPSASGTARFVTPVEKEPIVDALKKRYGFGYTVIAFVNRLRGISDYVVIELQAT